MSSSEQYPAPSGGATPEQVAEAIERRKNILRGNLAQAVASLGQATYALGHSIRTSPMKGVGPATLAGIEDAEKKIAQARTKMRTAIAEVDGIAALERTL